MSRNYRSRFNGGAVRHVLPPSETREALQEDYFRVRQLIEKEKNHSKRIGNSKSVHDIRIEVSNKKKNDQCAVNGYATAAAATKI